MDKILDLVTVLAVLLPVVIQAVKLFGVLTHNKAVVTLTDRALIIVQSLDSTGLTNEERKIKALEKLTGFATEAGIKLTPSQAGDYIESAVQELRQLQKLAGGEKYGSTEEN